MNKLIATALALTAVAATSVITTNPSELIIYKKEMFERINKSRQGQGLPALCLNEKMMNIAQNYAGIQASKNQGGHFVGGVAPEQRAGSIRYFAENLAEGPLCSDGWSGPKTHEIFMNNDVNRQNIMNPAYTHIGIGRATGSRNNAMYYYWVVWLAQLNEPCNGVPLQYYDQYMQYPSYQVVAP